MKAKAYIASMKSDLSELVTAEEAYFADSSSTARLRRAPRRPRRVRSLLRDDR